MNTENAFCRQEKNYPIQIHHDSTITKDSVLFEANTLQIYVNQHDDEAIKQALKRFYYQQCKSVSNQEYLLPSKTF